MRKLRKMSQTLRIWFNFLKFNFLKVVLLSGRHLFLHLLLVSSLSARRPLVQDLSKIKTGMCDLGAVHKWYCTVDNGCQRPKKWMTPHESPHTCPGDLSTSMWVSTDNSTFPQHYSHVWWRIRVPQKFSPGNFCTFAKISGEFAKALKMTFFGLQTISSFIIHTKE